MIVIFLHLSWTQYRIVHRLCFINCEIAYLFGLIQNIFFFREAHLDIVFRSCSFTHNIFFFREAHKKKIYKISRRIKNIPLFRQSRLLLVSSFSKRSPEKSNNTLHSTQLNSRKRNLYCNQNTRTYLPTSISSSVRFGALRDVKRNKIHTAQLKSTHLTLN